MKTITKNSLLYKSKVEYANFCINHVLGCAHGCRYPCYAMMMAKRFGKIKNYEDWLCPRIVSNALDLLDKEIPRYKDQIEFVHLSFTTDPFMYKYDEVGELSLKILEKLNKNGIKSTTLTKGVYPKELGDKGKYGSKNIYGITLVSLDEKFRKKFEPYSAPFKERINSLKHLHEYGLKTWVSMEPYPTPNLVDQDILDILNEISFVDRIVFGRLNYNKKVNEFQDANQFFDNCAKTVIKFCKKKKIDYHIKFGTQRKYDKSTEVVLNQN